jgi:D-cysteine desulfhydrase family pyridoxal phosphate-dependent enzyme
LLDSQPRFRLATLPTPIQEAARLRAALGGPARCPRILLKRDDLTGLALGGNKARKLEFLVGDARGRRATVLVTTGAVQSNHARMTAAAARAAGLQVVLVLTTRDPQPALEGNLLLDRILGATIRYVPAGDDPALATGEDEPVVAAVVDELESRGERPYVIPIGGSSAIGVIGYVEATSEMMDQLRAAGEAPSRLYFASGSRGTHAGLALGARMFDVPYELYGVAVSGGESWKVERAYRVAREAAAILHAHVQVSPELLATDQGYIGDGYGIPTAGTIDAIRLLARAEGILLDPIYTGKAMACLVDHVRRGLLDPASTVLFLHTGGAPGLFAHAGAFGEQ